MTYPAGMVGGVGSRCEYRRSAGAVHSIGWRMFVRTPADVSAAWVAHQGCTSNVLRSEFCHLGNVPAVGPKRYVVAPAGRVSEATIRKYIGDGTTGPRGKF